MRKIFISFSENDREKVSILENRLKSSEYLTYLIVADNYDNSSLISEKIISALESCQYIIPILTKNSLNNQWVNQEIGYAKCLKQNIKFFTLIQDDVIGMSKGFIHKEMTSLFVFKSDEKNENRRID